MRRKNEHPFDAITRCHNEDIESGRLGKQSKFRDLSSRTDIRPEGGFWFKHRYMGWVFYDNPVSKLNTCELCGRMGTSRKVTYRSDVYTWNIFDKKDFTTKSKDVLCVGCWNKARAIAKRKNEYHETRIFLNKMRALINNERKNKNDR